MNRGEGFRNQTIIDYPLVLDLTQKVEKKDSYCKFNLVGVVKRVVDNKGAEYYIAIYLHPYQNCWVLSDRYNLTQINNPYHIQGMEMLLFYSYRDSFNKLGEFDFSKKDKLKYNLEEIEEQLENLLLPGKRKFTNKIDFVESA